MKRTEFIEKSLIKTTLLLFITVFALSCASGKKEINDGDKIVMEKSILLDKIKGGWAGQTIGCTYGGLTEFLSLPGSSVRCIKTLT